MSKDPRMDPRPGMSPDEEIRELKAYQEAVEDALHQVTTYTYWDGPLAGLVKTMTQPGSPSLPQPRLTQYEYLLR